MTRKVYLRGYIPIPTDEIKPPARPGCGNDSGENGPFWKLVGPSRSTCIVTRCVVSITYDLCVIVKVSLFETNSGVRIEPESYSESSNCGDMVNFVSNRCHIPSCSRLPRKGWTLNRSGCCRTKSRASGKSQSAVWSEVDGSRWGSLQTPMT